MFIYSKKIIQFVGEIVSVIKKVLVKEIGWEVRKDRFYDPLQFSYPIKVVIYNNRSLLGYFDAEFYELGFHECLMHVEPKQLHNIIRHELAHYLSFIRYGRSIDPHGVEFKNFCRQLGWDEEVCKATFTLEPPKVLEEKSVILRKVQKLMALSTSSNQHEAEQAMIKSQQLLLKHNMECTQEINEEIVILKRIMKQKRETAKMRAIGKILETFFVSPVYNRTENFTYLEVVGSLINVEITEYVAGVLDIELDKLWDQAQKQANLKGTVAKNSFFLGLARGYCQKVQALKREYSSVIANAVLVIENQLIEAKNMVYKRLVTGRSQGGYCGESSAIGEKMGKQLTINPGINRSPKKSDALLAYLS